jgi:hypothetical protein
VTLSTPVADDPSASPLSARALGTAPRWSAAPSARRADSLLPEPARSPELAHMTLDRLRAYRRTLLEEELRVSYWRRLLQARRDLLRAGSQPGDRRGLRGVLSQDRGTGGRQAILMLHPEGGMPVLPNLPELWATAVDATDEEAAAHLYTRLTSAESVLSSYREALHRRLDRATADLVARYHDDPRQCLVALPGHVKQQECLTRA